VKSRVPAAVSGQPDAVDVAEAASPPGRSSPAVDERLKRECRDGIARGAADRARGEILHRNRSCEISVAFDPTAGMPKDFSFVIDDFESGPGRLRGGSAPAVRFVNMIANSDFAAAEVSPWLVAREGGLSAAADDQLR